MPELAGDSGSVQPDWRAEANAFVRDRLSRGDESIPKDELARLVDDWDATIADVAVEMSAYWDPATDLDEDLLDHLGFCGPASDMALDEHRLA